MKPHMTSKFTPFSTTLWFLALAFLLACAPRLNAQPRDQDLLAAAVSEQAAVIATLERLVNIETGTGDAQGMALMGQYLERELRALGATVVRHPALAGVVGDNIVGTSGTAIIKATFKGKAAHSGVNPEAGVNAMVEAADFMLSTLELDNKAQSFRFNWTVGTGGQVHNIIPAEAMIEANVRYINPEQLTDAMKKLEARAAKPRLPGAKIELSLLLRRPAFVADAATAAQTGKPVVESLGLPGYGYHSDEAEYVLIDAIPRRLYLASRMLMDIASGQ
jgi:acetylornithine deacetylase/succinyl-diaminopimelate desuccinylase-like protein